MNDAQLNDLLHSVRVPDRTAEEWNEFAGDVTRRVHGREPVTSAPLPAHRPGRIFALWTVIFASSCLLVIFLAGPWHAQRGERIHGTAEARKLFLELSEVFPQQIEAIILTDSAPRLILSDQPLPRDTPPLYVRICGANGCQRIITFSGANLPLNGQRCDVLLDVRGNVIVAGDRFVWTSADHNPTAGGYRIEAEQLAGLL